MAPELSQPATNRLNSLLIRLSSLPRCVLVLAVVAMLGAFIHKPFHLDDPIFLRAARQIQAHPANPYGFTVNWYGTVSPMWEVMKNPPLVCYYIRVCAALMGWTEPALHLALLLPALAVILGTYELARRLCHRPMLAAGTTLITPVFLISSTTLMCDVLMLAFWVWATVLWFEGTKRNSNWCLCGAAFLMALAGLTKYFGVALVPLLAAWTWLARRRPGTWLGWFLVPLAILVGYQLWTRTLYGQELLSDASEYALALRVPSSLMERLLTSLSFTGGCLAVGVFLAPLLWRRRALVVGLVVVVLTALILGAGGFMVKRSAVPLGYSRAAMAIQIAIWSGGGFCVLALAALDIVARRDADSWLLGLWVGGTFLFAAFLNWTVSGRSILPMAVPFGILIARRLAQRSSAESETWRLGVVGPLLAGAALAWVVARSDFLLAQAARQTAQAVAADYGQGKHTTLWFEGHWGFQHYLEAAGASALDLEKSPVNPGDHIALPRNNSNIRPLGKEVITFDKEIVAAGPTRVTTMSKALGAGFYSSVWGPLPFSFGRVPPEGADVYVVTSSPVKPVKTGAGE